MIQSETDVADGPWSHLTFRASCKKRPVTCLIILILSTLFCYDLGLRIVLHIRIMVNFLGQLLMFCNNRIATYICLLFPRINKRKTTLRWRRTIKTKMNRIITLLRLKRCDLHVSLNTLLEGTFLKR